MTVAAATTANTCRAHPRPRLRAQLEVKLVSSLTPDEVLECEAMSLPRGNMGPKLAQIRSNMRPEVRNIWYRRALETETVLLLRHKGALVAWALIMCVNPRAAPRAWLFVAPAYRRQGLGSRLVHEIARRWKGVEFQPWDAQSAAFFEAYGHLSYNCAGENFLRARRECVKNGWV